MELLPNIRPLLAQQDKLNPLELHVLGRTSEIKNLPVFNVVVMSLINEKISGNKTRVLALGSQSFSLYRLHSRR
jgi:hypothetical protein